jgi:hypothetical protein
LISAHIPKEGQAAFLVAGCAPTAFRFFQLMMVGATPMVSLRLVRHRLIVPELDIVFVMPACAILTTLLFAFALAGAPFFVVWPATLFVQIMLAVDGRPTPSDWQLTGPIRLVPPTRTGNTSRKTLRTRP